MEQHQIGAQALEASTALPERAGRWLELKSNFQPRGMIVTLAAKPLNRIRLTDALSNPLHQDLIPCSFLKTLLSVLSLCLYFFSDFFLVIFFKVFLSPWL